jgi:hypothetical protein
MPLYRFQIESSLPADTVLDRVRALVREAPAFWPSLKESFGSRPENAPPFIGKVEGNEFRIYRDIRYRNSFLPRVYGKVVSSLSGAQIDVTMTLHPAVTVFILFWLGVVGFGAAVTAAHSNLQAALIPLGMFVFGVTLTLVGFFPEALKARRLLEQTLDISAPNQAMQRTGR